MTTRARLALPLVALALPLTGCRSMPQARALQPTVAAAPAYDALASSLATATPRPALAAAAGSTRHEIEQHDFFRYFDFHEVSRTTEEKGVEVMYLPGDAAPYPVAAGAGLLIDDQDRVLRMSLVVDRTYMNTPKYDRFARDVVKSFILAAMPSVDMPSVLDVAREIWASPSRGLRNAAASPSPPSRGYSVFLGEQKGTLYDLTSARFRIFNGLLGDQPALYLLVEPS